MTIPALIGCGSAVGTTSMGRTAYAAVMPRGCPRATGRSMLLVGFVAAGLVALAACGGGGSKQLALGTATCTTGTAQRVGIGAGSAVDAAGFQKVSVASDGQRLVARLELGPQLLSPKPFNQTLATVTLYIKGDLGHSPAEWYQLQWGAAGSAVSEPPQGPTLLWKHKRDGQTHGDTSPLRSRVDSTGVSLEASLDQLSALPPQFKWSARITVLDSSVQAALGDRDTTTESTCPPNPDAGETLAFPQQPLPEATSPGSIPTSPAVTGASGSSATTSASARSLSCPLPLPDRLSPDQAADCAVSRWAAGDRGGAIKFATGDSAVRELFSVPAKGAPSALGCAPTSKPPLGDPNPYGTPMVCTYRLAGGGSTSVYVDSTPSAGAVVFATSR